ncbi:MAG: hypothetical protein J6R71_00555 [Bacteroidales bacterium]|nr:hypothetical protein [Bacteroidales bacterium]
MKRTKILLSLVFCALASMSLQLFAEDKNGAESNAQSSKTSIGLDFGYEDTRETFGYEKALFFEWGSNKNPNTAFYTRLNLHSTDELWVGETVVCDKYLLELGANRYFPLVKEMLYPYISFGLGAGVQHVNQIAEYRYDVVDKEYEYLITASTNIGLEYLLTKNIAIHLKYRMMLEHSGIFHAMWGGGVKYCF